MLKTNEFIIFCNDLLYLLRACAGEAASNNSVENHDLHCVKCNSAQQPACRNGTKDQLHSMSSECQYKNLSPQARLPYGTDHEGKAWRCLKVTQNVPDGTQIVFRECAFLLPEQAIKEESYCRYRSSPSGTNAQVSFCRVWKKTVECNFFSCITNFCICTCRFATAKTNCATLPLVC